MGLLLLFSKDTLTGTIISTSALSGTLSCSKPVSGVIASTTSVSGALSNSISLAGNVGATSSLSGPLSVQWSLKGSVTTSSSISGTLGILWSLKGVISATSTVSAAASASWSLKGSIAATSSVSGAIIESTYLAGSTSAISAISGTLTLMASMSGTVSAVSSIQGLLSFVAEDSGTYYAKLGSTILTSLENDSFRITEELNKIPSFEFEMANNSANRTAIADGITDTLTIHRRLDSTDTLMFTGRIDVDAIEYLSLERIRIPGYASYIDLNFRFHQHLNSEDAEDVDVVFDYFPSILEDFTTFTEVDIGSDRIQKTTHHVDHYACRGEVTYLYKDYGVGHFDDFSHKIKFRTETVPLMNSGAFWMLADDVGDIYYLLDKKCVLLFPDSSNLYLQSWYLDNDTSDVMYSLAANTWYYVLIEKTGTSMTAKIYTNSDYTGLVDTLSITLQGDFTYRYLYACNTMNSYSGYCANHDIDNFKLTLQDYTEYTAQANNDTINDVFPTFGGVNNAFYIGQGEQFFGAQVKYSTKGVQAGSTTVVFEFSKGSGVWSTLDVLDETRAFTEDPGTYYITIPHKPSDWAKDTVNGVKKFWIRARVTAGAYTTSPKLDRIKITNVDVCRVFYLETAANSIMDDVLDGTGYSMDGTDVCPSDAISMVGEYTTKLIFIAGVANALTWDDSGDKKAYQWWVDTSKKVHFKPERGTVRGDITENLVILNNVMDYFNLSNRLSIFGNYDGLNKVRAVIENTSSQDTHGIRELAILEEQYNNYIPLKEAAQKAMTHTKAPLQKIAAALPTTKWLANSLEVGDTVTIHQPRWNVDEQAFQIVRADIGPRVTNLDIGVSQEHLDGLKAGLQRQMDISGIRMHGSTSILQFGPETMNYQRVNDSTVYPARLKIDIPSDVRYIHKVLLSWTISPYRASVGPNSSSVPPHSHGGYTGVDGAHDHGAVTGSADPHAHSFLEKETGYKILDHTHIINEVDTANQLVTLTHELYADHEGYLGGGHKHSLPAYTGAYDNDDELVANGWSVGTACASGWCVTGIDGVDVPSTTHLHHLGGAGGSTTGSTAHQHSVVGTIGGDLADDLHKHTIAGTESGGIANITGDWQHAHSIPDSDDAGGESRSITSDSGHNKHAVTASETVDIETSFDIHEIAPGTTLELIINGETIASDYVGAQTDIRIDGFLTTGTNSIEIQPIVGDISKGGVTQFATGIVFIEAKKF